MVCVNVIVFTMGCGGNLEYQSTFGRTVKIVTDILQRISVSSTVLTDLSATDFSGQGITVCDTIPKLTTSTLNTITNVTIDQRNEIVNKLQSEVTQQINGLDKTTQDLLTRAINGATIADVILIINRSIESSLTQETINNIIRNVANKNKTRLDIYLETGGIFTGDACISDQNILLNIMATNIVAAAVTGAQNNTDIQKMQDVLDQMTATSNGTDSFFTTTSGYIVIAILILILILGVGYLGFIYFKDNSDTNKKNTLETNPSVVPYQQLIDETSPYEMMAAANINPELKAVSQLGLYYPRSSSNRARRIRYRN